MPPKDKSESAEIAAVEKKPDRLAELVAEKRRAGLPESDAITCARAQIAEDEANAPKKKKAE